MRSRRRLIGAAIALLSLASCGTTRAVIGRAQALVGGPSDIVRIPDQDQYGQPFALEARLCRPRGASPAPVAVLNHGPASWALLADMRPLACTDPAVAWFTAQGYIVLLPMRRGFGASGGDWAESPGPCASPDYAAAAQAGAHDIALAVGFARTLPGLRPDPPVVVGWDSGALATLAYAAAALRGTKAVAMAPAIGTLGGAGAGHVCRPDLLVEAAGRLGATARIATLWVVAGNDGFIPPELATDMAAAFRAAGGKAALELPETSLPEGHDLFFAPAGVAIWGPIVQRFLRS